jgi:hypothetical protein
MNDVDDTTWSSEREVVLERVQNKSFGISIVGGKVSQWKLKKKVVYLEEINVAEWISEWKFFIDYKWILEIFVSAFGSVVWAVAVIDLEEELMELLVMQVFEFYEKKRQKFCDS